MQGQKCRAVYHDEEGVDEEVWDECATRLTDNDGWHLMTNTPVDGITWVDGRLVAKTAENAEHDCQVYEIHSVDNPHLSARGLAKLGRGNDAMRDAKLYGRATSRQGRVWPRYSRQVHAIPRMDLDPSWTRFRAIDFGTRNPFVCLWSCLTGSRVILDDGRIIPEGSLVFYREHYQAEQTLKWHAARIHEAEGWEWDADRGEHVLPEEGAVEAIEMTWADPEDAAALMSLVRDYDVDAVPALKAVSDGIDKVSVRLQAAEGGTVSMFFFDDLPNTLREVPGYVWADGSRAADAPNRPKKKNDHTCDCVRYTAMGESRY